MKTSVMVELIVDHDEDMDIEMHVQSLAGETIADYRVGTPSGPQKTAVIDEVRVIQELSK